MGDAKRRVLKIKSLKYKIIQDELLADCNVLRADVLNNSNMLRNRLILSFTDCKGNVVAENKASSMYKEFDLGFQDALNLSLEKVQIYDKPFRGSKYYEKYTNEQINALKELLLKLKNGHC